MAARKRLGVGSTLATEQIGRTRARGRISRSVARPVLALLLLGGAFLFLLGGTGHAAPAAPNVIKSFTQPDGSKLQLRLWGDEFINGWETRRGMTVVKARSGEWQFAVRDRRGELKPSGIAPGEGLPPTPLHLRPSEAAFNRARADFGAPALGQPYAAAPPAWAGNDTDVLFLMVEFTDRGCTFTPNQMQQNMFGATATGPGNLEEYFDEVSGGDLQVDGTVVGNQAGTDCITLPETHAFYDTGDGDAWELVEDAVEAADDWVDYEQYDNDGDDRVDQMGIIYAGGGPHDGCDTDNGAGGGDGDDLWPHFNGGNNTETDDEDADDNDIEVQNYILNSELTHPIAPGWTCNAIQTIGLFAHEMGHGLGLPDLYDTDGSSAGVGVWSAMASQYLSTTNLADTPPHYDPWSKWFLDWVTPTEYTNQNTVVSLDKVETTGEVAQLLANPGGAERGGVGEYFLVENRQLEGFDAKLPGCGVLVWHIEESQNQPNRENAFEGHTLASHRLVDIEEADGLDELDGNNAADNGDPFPGSANNRLFDGASDPTSNLYSGVASGVRLRFQDTCKAAMRVSVGPNDAPNADAGGPYATDEGTDVALDGSASSDPDGDEITHAWDLDNDGAYDDSTAVKPDFSLVGQDGTFTVGLKVTDPYGLEGTDTAQVTVANVAPSLSGIDVTAGPQGENSPVTVVATITDPGWLDDLSATVDWGDGTAPQTIANLIAEDNFRPDASGSIDVTRTYGDDGAFTITICGLDDDTSTCAARSTVLTNVDPTATIDLSGATTVNGVQTVIGEAGLPVAVQGRSTDRGSDDLALGWTWGDGTPDTWTRYLNDPLFDPDPDPSATVNPRDVTDAQSHTYGKACTYEMMFTANDDDAGTASDNASVIITGNANRAFGHPYWKNQYKDGGRHAELDHDMLLCYLAITRYGSDVYDELRPLATFADANDVLNLASRPVPMDKQLDRELLAGWLNFANGAYGFDQKLLDTNGDGTADLSFGEAAAAAEIVRLDPSSTVEQMDKQREILFRFNQYRP
ncbi:MAG: M6 family metalloprotease domain-containing protein [Actinomycetota bacterium]